MRAHRHLSNAAHLSNLDHWTGLAKTEAGLRPAGARSAATAAEKVARLVTPVPAREVPHVPLPTNVDSVLPHSASRKTRAELTPRRCIHCCQLLPLGYECPELMPMMAGEVPAVAAVAARSSMLGVVARRRP